MAAVFPVGYAKGICKIDTAAFRCRCPAGIRCPNAGFHSLCFQNDLLNFTLDGNGHIKIAGFKETENRAEVKAYIECPVLFFGIVSAEPLREGTGVKSFDFSVDSPTSTDSIPAPSQPRKPSSFQP